MKLSINFDAFKPLLKDFFSQPESFIKEACQNSERAGATHIEITYDDNSRVMLIEDNGHGFSDNSWKAFFDICTSEWDERVGSEQKPFGIGALSLLVPSSEVVIWSRYTTEMYCDDLLTNNDYESTCTVTDEFYKGTMVALRIKDDFNILQVLRNINDIFKGFPLPVIFNGKEIARPNTFDDSKMVNTDFGSIDISKISEFGSFCDVSVYLQGYLIESLSSKSRSSSFIVHLDSNKFRARVPDRTQLVSGAEECSQMINEYLINAYRAFLMAKYEEIGADLFAINYWNEAKTYLPSIAKSLPLPVKYIKTPSCGYFVHEDEEDLYAGVNKELQSKLVVNETDINIITKCFLHDSRMLDYVEFTDISDEESRSLLCHNFMYMNQSSFVDFGTLPNEHWVLDHIRFEDEIIDWNVSVSGNCHNGDIKAYDCMVNTQIGDRVYLSIDLSDGTTLSTNSDVSGFYLKGTLYAPRKLRDFTELMRSIFSCNIGGEWGFELDYSRLTQILESFNVNVSILMSDNIETALKNVFENNKHILEELKKVFGNHKVTFELGNESNFVTTHL
jgi:hypothetical protein